jgi:hypothetical protein
MIWGYPKMGLLNRARTLDEGTYYKTAGNPLETAEKILRYFPYTTDHVDYSGGVFYAFKELLGFSRGSLLLPDRVSGTYYPLIAIGFDRTTTRRLRIPIDFSSAENTRPGCLNTVRSREMEPMFSNRENGLTDDLALSFLGPPEMPSALLLTAECGWKNGIPEDLQNAVMLMNQRLGPGIEHSRRLTVEPEGEEAEDPKLWLENWGERKGVLALISLNHLIRLYVGMVAGIEPFFAREDSVNLIRRITGRMGRLFNLKDDRILIMFPPERLADRHLFLHQLTVSVKSAFLKLPEPPLFQAEFLQWPQERSVVEERLPGFF